MIEPLRAGMQLNTRICPKCGGVMTPEEKRVCVICAIEIACGPESEDEKEAN